VGRGVFRDRPNSIESRKRGPENGDQKTGTRKRGPENGDRFIFRCMDVAAIARDQPPVSGYVSCCRICPTMWCSAGTTGRWSLPGPRIMSGTWGSAGAEQCGGHPGVCVLLDDEPRASVAGPRRGGGRHGSSDEGVSGQCDAVSQSRRGAFWHLEGRPL